MHNWTRPLLVKEAMSMHYSLTISKNMNMHPFFLTQANYSNTHTNSHHHVHTNKMIRSSTYMLKGRSDIQLSRGHISMHCKPLPPPTPVNVATCERQRAANVHVVVVELNLAWESGWLQHGRDQGVFLDLRGVRHGCMKRGRGGDMADVSLPPLARCWGWPRHVVPSVGVPKWRRSGRLAGLGLGFRPTQQWREGRGRPTGWSGGCMWESTFGPTTKGEKEKLFCF